MFSVFWTANVIGWQVKCFLPVTLRYPESYVKDLQMDCPTAVFPGTITTLFLWSTDIYFVRLRVPSSLRVLHCLSSGDFPSFPPQKDTSCFLDCFVFYLGTKLCSNLTTFNLFYLSSLVASQEICSIIHSILVVHALHFHYSPSVNTSMIFRLTPQGRSFQMTVISFYSSLSIQGRINIRLYV